MSTPEHSFFNDETFKRLFDNYKKPTVRLCAGHSALALYGRRNYPGNLYQALAMRGYPARGGQPGRVYFTIARNKTLNHLRKAAHDVKLLRELQERAMPENNNVEERTLLTEYDRLLRDALALLSPQRRLVYQLNRDRGLNHEEIAHHLHLSRNTVKNHMVEALRHLRHYLGEHGSGLMIVSLFLITS